MVEALDVSPPDLQAPRRGMPPPLLPRRRALADALLAAALAAHKAGALHELLRRRPRLTEAFARELLGPVQAVAGDALPADPAHPAAWRLLLRAALASLRPDRALGLAGIERQDWIARTPWRPLLALMCHAGFEPVPSFPEHYRARAGEPAVDQLCGLWGVAPSTFYRYVEKGRRRLADALFGPPLQADAALARDARLQHELGALRAHADGAARVAWHRRQAAAALQAHAVHAGGSRPRDAQGPRAALWHLLCAGDADGFIRTLQRHRADLAGHPDTDALLKRLAMLPLDARWRAELALARATLLRARGDEQREADAIGEALRIAADADDALMLGIVHAALGKFHEPRDQDKAFACYQEAADFLRRAGLTDDPAAAGPGLLRACVGTLVRLGWLYVLRNDPRSRAALDQAEALRAPLLQPAAVPRAASAGDAARAPTRDASPAPTRDASPAPTRDASPAPTRDAAPVPPALVDDAPDPAQAAQLVAELDQAWGEYWRRSGDLPRALEHKHRALQVYERLGDREAVLKTYANLSLVYGDAKDFARAIDCAQRVLAMAERFAVPPETVAGTLMNLGAACFWQGRYDQAIEHYGRALDLSRRAALRVFVGRGHYNLAEAHYKRFQALGDAEDERLGDAHVGAALACWPEGTDAAAHEATRQLKREVLGPRDEPGYDRLLPAELAAHFEEMARVQRQRALLAVPLPPERQVAAQLEVARAYLEIAVKEREAAVQLIERHGLAAQFGPALQALRAVFERRLSREQRLAARWREGSADVLDSGQAAQLLQHLLAAGAINKSAYARLCGVALATASKHLGRLAASGLLLQQGRGPGTRYVLPDDEAG